MNDSYYAKIQGYAEQIGVDLAPEEVATLVENNSMDESGMASVSSVLEYMARKKHDAKLTTLLQTSRLPLKEPKTFANFDFGKLNGKDVGALESLPSLSAINARKNIAFIGPQGVGKTHLAMAYGRACCEAGLRTYFVKATELNQKLYDAIKLGRVKIVESSLINPSCLIVDEVGRCVFDKECTRLFFDIVDRRCSKECPNMMIFTSNSEPGCWGEFFSDDSSLLCALDRIFDNATVFMIKGESYRGRRCGKIALTAGDTVTKLQSK